MINIFDIGITWKEAPMSSSGSLTVFVGFPNKSCRFHCDGCSWGKDGEKPIGEPLSLEKFRDILNKKRKYTDFVCFLGDGGCGENLIEYLRIVKEYGMKTLLYTGGKVDDYSKEVLKALDWIKTGRWEGKSLEDVNTNQKIFKLADGNIIGIENYKAYYV